MKFDFTDTGDYAGDLSDIGPTPSDRVVFSTYDEDYGIVPAPQAASDQLPQWFDPEETDDAIVDALTEGWVLRSIASIRMFSDDQGFSWSSKFDREPLATHDPNQMGDFNVPFEIIKFESYWTVKLPDGYSALMTEPFGQRNTDFTPFSGSVDFDVFPTVTHMPCLLESSGKTIVPAATPIAQVIPYKRDDLLDTARVRSATPEEAAELEDGDEEDDHVDKERTGIAHQQQVE